MVEEVKITVTRNPNESLWLALSKAAQSVVASRPFLDSIASVMRKLPEGQTAQTLKEVAADLLQTLETFDKAAEKSHNICGATNALSEVYAYVFENANVTTTNSVLVGASLRNAGNFGISGPLANLIGTAFRDLRCGVRENAGGVSTEATGLGHKNQARSGVPGQQKEATGDGLQPRETCDGLNASKICFLLRVFLAYRSLDRQCRSLMPPKVAKKANAEAGEPVLNFFSMNSKEIYLSLLGRKLFSCVGLHTEHLPDILASIEEVRDHVDDKYPALAYLLDCLAIQRLVDLNKHLRMLKFLRGEFDKLQDAAPSESDSDGLPQALSSLQQEISALVVFIGRGVMGLSRSMEHVLAKADVDAQAAMAPENPVDVRVREWDMIISTLKAETLPVARWRLMCLTVDVWSEHATESLLESFVASMLGSLCHRESRRGAVAENTFASRLQSTTLDQSTSVKNLTESLFTDSQFFEQHVKSSRKLPLFILKCR